MPIRMPQLRWPAELQEEGPHQDPSIILVAAVVIDSASYRIQAMRIDLDSLEPDFRADLEEDNYADHRIYDIFEELIFLDNFDRSSVLSLESGNYIFWMAPVSLESGVQKDFSEEE